MEHSHITIPYALKSSEARLELSKSLSLLIAARPGRHCDSLPAHCELEIRSPALSERHIMDSIRVWTAKMRKEVTLAVLACTSLAWAQMPSGPDTTALVERAHQKASAYTQSLPDFVATEIIRRYVGLPGTDFHRPPFDRLTIQLRYFQHQEEHKLIQVNGELARSGFEDLHGLMGSGEFGVSINAIFQPDSQTSFRFQKWVTVRQRPAARFAFEVDVAHSHFTLGSSATRVVVGYYGIVEIDAKTGEVLHLEYIADHIPKELRLGRASTAVDYSLTDIGGRQYLLPSRSRMELRGLEEWARNVIEFRDYGKFSADSTIDFDP
jgi:hypothetical protein